MTTSDILAVAATGVGIVMAVAPILQIRRMRRTRSSNDVSLLWLAMLDVGFVVWVSYGWSITNWALVVSNAASFLVMTITIVTALTFRRGGARRAAAARAVEDEARAARDADAAPGSTAGH